MKIHLSDEPVRTDLTDRECAKIIGGIIGSLTQVADAAAVRQAVRWWADTDEAWHLIDRGKQAGMAWMKEEGYIS